MKNNIINMTDSYKVSHWKQYPKGTERVYSFFESRGGKYNNTVFFGLQYILKKYLVGKVVTHEMIDSAKEYMKNHFGTSTLFNENDWRSIVNDYDGYLPIEIYAVPEGMSIPTRNVLMTVVNTDPRFPWLTNYLETILCQVWYPTTVCTQSRHMRSTIEYWNRLTGADVKSSDDVAFRLHDFGYRGSTSVESAGIGGAAHLVNFKGTDTLAGVNMLMKYYGAEMPGFSIPAAEHSTITSWGRDNEVKAYENMLDQFEDCPFVAVVSDSYNIYESCSDLWGKRLKDKVLQRNGVLVVRPDSGDPTVVVPSIINILMDRFGSTTNSKGFNVLNEHVRVIQGDGITADSINDIYKSMYKESQSAENITFGSGGGLLQQVNRDTQKFAFKCSSIQINGEWFDVFKDPITDGGKTSKKGMFRLVEEDGCIKTVSSSDDENWRDGDNIMVPVFRNGKLLVDYTLDDIRNRSKVLYK